MGDDRRLNGLVSRYCVNLRLEWRFFNDRTGEVNIMTKTPEQVDPENSETQGTGIKKSVVKGLPTSAPVRSGFANGGRPEFKAKSSKATGAKKRVRQ